MTCGIELCVDLVIDLLLQRALRSRDMETENAQLREQLEDKYGMESLVGNSPAMRRVFDVIRQAVVRTP